MLAQVLNVLARPESPRAALRKQIGARPAAAKAVEDARAAVERARQSIEAAGTAASSAKTALSEAEARAHAWAEAGSVGTPPDTSAAEDASRRANSATTLAAGARKALPALEEAASTAQSVRETVEGQVRAAAVDVLLYEIAGPAVERALAARETYFEALQTVEALLQLTNPRWGDQHPFHGLSSGHERAQELDRQLALPQLETDPNTRELARSLNAFVRRLCDDADETWEA